MTCYQFIRSTASTSARASSDQQAIETLSESAVLTQSKTRDVENVINEVEQEVVFPVAQEQLHELPPLPNSAISEKFSNESKSMVEEGNVGLDEDMNGLVLSNGINTPQKAQDFKDDGEGNLDGIIDQEQNESTKAKVDPGNVVMDSGEAQIQTDEENIKFTSNHNDEKLQMKERLKI
ncbi:hypothetical protein O181_090518 [Austropuccinia psidii MF-1]|uniref:Uncharacterized protein n=1 Tax=Austropuccinia psidii MF-1 TaxID=1389203 RepID=A0A9Q3P6L5_9BASI|nr:hypothetical protein [Austropuccinia psidii MF-1]